MFTYNNNIKYSNTLYSLCYTKYRTALQNNAVHPNAIHHIAIQLLDQIKNDSKLTKNIGPIQIF